MHTIERISRGVESTFTWRGESSFDVRVKRWKRWERWMTRRERLWNEMDEGWRQASRKVLQPDSVQRGLSRHLCQLSPLRHWIERKREGVGTGAFADRKFKRSTYLIRWLNGSRARSSFPVLLWKRLMLLQFSVAESVTDEIHESAHNPRFSFTRLYSRLFPRTCHRHWNEYHRIVVNVIILIVRGVDEVESVICLGHRYSGK